MNLMGLNIICVTPPAPKQHIAKRRGSRGHIRSRRLWIDKVYSRILQPDDAYQMGDTIYAGESIYQEIMKIGWEDQFKYGVMRP